MRADFESRQPICLIMSFALLTSCGPRHVELQNGSGPQGRERLSPQPPESNGNFSIWAFPNDLSPSRSHWNFDLVESWNGYWITTPVAIDPKNGTSGGSGSSSCLDSTSRSSFDDCLKILVQLPSVWKDSATPAYVPAYDLYILGERTGRCKVLGRFDGESGFSEWGQGDLKLISFGKKELVYPKGVNLKKTYLQIQADALLTDPLAEPVWQAFAVIGEDDRYFTLVMRWPVRTFSNKRVIFLSYPGVTKFSETTDSSGELSGAVEYFYPETNDYGSAKLKIECTTPDGASPLRLGTRQQSEHS